MRLRPPLFAAFLFSLNMSIALYLGRDTPKWLLSSLRLSRGMEDWHKYQLRRVLGDTPVILDNICHEPVASLAFIKKSLESLFDCM